MPKSQNTNSKSTFIKAAYRILEKEEKALHIREISDKAIKQGLIKSSGKTPQHTIGSFIYRDIKEKGEKSDFVKIREATFTLRKLISEKNNKLKKKEGSFLDLAEVVLEKSGEPMHYKKIVKRAKDEGLSRSGKTPEATMRGAINTDIKKREIHGEKPRFTRAGRGVFGLTVWDNSLEESKLAKHVETHNQQIKKELKEYLLNMNPYDFEEFIAEELLPKMGFIDNETTPRSNDGGIDARGTLAISNDIKIKFAVQAKRWKGKVGSDPVNNLRGSIDDHTQGMIIATSGFHKGAKGNANRENAKPISLVDIDALIELMLKYKIGVTHSSIEIYKIDEEFLYFNNAEDNE